MADKPILVLGLGNDILRDDGVGLRVARTLSELFPADAAVEVKETTLSGLNLLEIVAGFRELYIVDSICDPGRPCGEMFAYTDRRTSLLPLRLSFLHDADIFTTLELGRRLGLPMPRLVRIFAINVADPWTLDESCSPELTALLPALAAAIRREVLPQ